MTLPQKNPSPANAQCAPEDLVRISSEAWGNFDVHELTIATDNGALKQTDKVFMASVSMKGTWNGTILLICPCDLVFTAAAGIFGEQDKETELSNAKDMLGEVANMIAGNVVELIDVSTSISLPVVAFGADMTMGIQDEKITAEVTMICNAKPIHLMVLETHLPIL